MSENVGQFRGAAFGGFHRQDVLDYLERITQEHQEKTQALTQALEEERTARRQDQAAREALEQELSTQTAAQQKLEEEQKETKRALEEARIALAAAEARAEALSGRVDELAPGAESWQRIRDTAGDIEVSAHERAQITVEAARIQAAEIRAEAGRWILDIQERCQRLKQTMGTSLAAAEQELDGVRHSFAAALEDIDGAREALAHLVSGLEESDH